MNNTKSNNFFWYLLCQKHSTRFDDLNGLLIGCCDEFLKLKTSITLLTRPIDRKSVVSSPFGCCNVIDLIQGVQDLAGSHLSFLTRVILHSAVPFVTQIICRQEEYVKA